jgi:hypothetical protein
MARPKPAKSGRRVNIWLPPESDKTASQIENLSAFVQLALRQASGIMAFDIIQRAKNLPQHKPPTAEAVERFNHDHPVDPLTAKRQGKKWPNTPNSQSIPDVLL